MATQDSNTVGAADAVARFPELLEQVKHGTVITITADGDPVAKLIPIRQRSSPKELDNAIRKWRESSKDVRLGDDLNLRDLIDEGRP